jgi:hypothetical protein
MTNRFGCSIMCMTLNCPIGIIRKATQWYSDESLPDPYSSNSLNVQQSLTRGLQHILLAEICFRQAGSLQLSLDLRLEPIPSSTCHFHKVSGSSPPSLYSPSKSEIVDKCEGHTSLSRTNIILPKANSRKFPYTFSGTSPDISTALCTKHLWLTRRHTRIRMALQNPSPGYRDLAPH